MPKGLKECYVVMRPYKKNAFTILRGHLKSKVKASIRYPNKKRGCLKSRDSLFYDLNYSLNPIDWPS